MPSDVLLVHKTLCGDEKAFHRLMRKYQTDIYTFILSWVENPSDAEELTQDVFMKAYQNLSSLREPSRFYPWLRRIAKNRCQDWQRKKQASFLSLHEVSATAKIQPVDELLLLREAISKVLQAMETLPEVEKKLLKERYLEDASYEELQVRHGLSYRAIAMRLFKARRKVREKVEKALKGIVAFPWQNAIKKLFLGGIEAMKISATTKLVTVWTATLLIVGGITVSVWHTKPPKQEMSEPREQSIKTSEIARDTSGYKKSSPKVLQPAQTNVASSQTDSTVVDSPMSEDADMAEWDAFLEEMSNSESSEETIPEPQEECFFGLTKAEIEAKIDVLEAEIRTSLTRAVFLYKDLRSTDGMAGNSPEIAEWRDETWAEVKRLFQDVARSKVPTYVSYLKVTGGDNPLVEGGWIYELMEPLPMGITYGGTSP